jgi:hypothetical protein
MARRIVYAACLVSLFLGGHALIAQPTAETAPCKTIRGRAHQYGGDGQLRIWHVGTHHEYTPDESSWQRVVEWLVAGVSYLSEPDKHYVDAPSRVYLFADFLVCPTEPFKEGSVQVAHVKSAMHRHYSGSSGGRR